MQTNQLPNQSQGTQASVADALCIPNEAILSLTKNQRQASCLIEITHLAKQLQTLLDLQQTYQRCDISVLHRLCTTVMTAERIGAGVGSNTACINPPRPPSLSSAPASVSSVLDAHVPHVMELASSLTTSTDLLHANISKCLTALSAASEELKRHAELNFEVARELSTQPGCQELALERELFARIQSEASTRSSHIARARGRCSLPPFSLSLTRLKSETANALRQLALQQQQHHNPHSRPAGPLPMRVGPSSLGGIRPSIPPVQTIVGLDNSPENILKQHDGHSHLEFLPHQEQQHHQQQQQQEEGRDDDNFQRPHNFPISNSVLLGQRQLPLDEAVHSPQGQQDHQEIAGRKQVAMDEALDRSALRGDAAPSTSTDDGSDKVKSCDQTPPELQQQQQQEHRNEADNDHEYHVIAVEEKIGGPQPLFTFPPLPQTAANSSPPCIQLGHHQPHEQEQQQDDAAVAPLQKNSDEHHIDQDVEDSPGASCLDTDKENLHTEQSPPEELPSTQPAASAECTLEEGEAVVAIAHNEGDMYKEAASGVPFTATNDEKNHKNKDEATGNDVCMEKEEFTPKQQQHQVQQQEEEQKQRDGGQERQLQDTSQHEKQGSLSLPRRKAGSGDGVDVLVVDAVSNNPCLARLVPLGTFPSQRDSSSPASRKAGKAAVRQASGSKNHNSTISNGVGDGSEPHKTSQEEGYHQTPGDNNNLQTGSQQRQQMQQEERQPLAGVGIGKKRAFDAEKCSREEDEIAAQGDEQDTDNDDDSREIEEGQQAHPTTERPRKKNRLLLLRSQTTTTIATNEAADAPSEAKSGDSGTTPTPSFAAPAANNGTDNDNKDKPNPSNNNNNNNNDDADVYDVHDVQPPSMPESLEEGQPTHSDLWKTPIIRGMASITAGLHPCHDDQTCTRPPHKTSTTPNTSGTSPEKKTPQKGRKIIRADDCSGDDADGDATQSLPHPARHHLDRVLPRIAGAEKGATPLFLSSLGMPCTLAGGMLSHAQASGMPLGTCASVWQHPTGQQQQQKLFDDSQDNPTPTFNRAVINAHMATHGVPLGGVPVLTAQGTLCRASNSQGLVPALVGFRGSQALREATSVPESQEDPLMLVASQ